MMSKKESGAFWRKQKTEKGKRLKEILEKTAKIDNLFAKAKCTEKQETVTAANGKW